MYVCVKVCLHTHICIYTIIVQDSLDSVEELLKKHEDFEKLLAAQEERFTQLNRETEVIAQSSLVHMCTVCTRTHIQIYVLYGIVYI